MKRKRLFMHKCFRCVCAPSAADIKRSFFFDMLSRNMGIYGIFLLFFLGRITTCMTHCSHHPFEHVSFLCSSSEPRRMRWASTNKTKKGFFLRFSRLAFYYLGEEKKVSHAKTLSGLLMTQKEGTGSCRLPGFSSPTLQPAYTSRIVHPVENEQLQYGSRSWKTVAWIIIVAFTCSVLVV